MKIEFKRLLFIGPHPDDVEFGCGGTIKKHGESADIRILVLAPCKEDPKNKNILTEAKSSFKSLGVSDDKLQIDNFERRIFQYNRPKIRKVFVDLRDSFEPDIVFCPSLSDIHQDHATVVDETFRIFRDKSAVVSYEVSRSTLHFTPNLYVELDEASLQSKIDALNCYKGQTGKQYFRQEVIRALALVRVSQVGVRGVKFAEAFEILKVRI